VTFSDLLDLDESEHASLRALLDVTLEEGTLFETFELSVATAQPPEGRRASGEGATGGGGERGGPAFVGAGLGTVRLVPAGPHKRVTEATKREYVLHRARCLLVDGVARQMEAVADGFWGLIPR